MTKKIARLERDTIAEATFEMRFQGTDAALSDLLPGILFAELKGRFPRTVRLPASELPRQLQQGDPDLKYAPRHALASDKFNVLVGDAVLQISNRRPYVGWAEFKPTIMDVLAVIDKGDFIRDVERFSLKYINVLEAKVDDLREQYSFIRLNAKLGEHDLASMLTLIRTEIHARGLINIIEVAPTARIRVSKEAQLEGLMVAVDTILNKPQDFRTNRSAQLDAVHDMEKEIYFGILTKETIARLRPEYE